MSRDDDLRNKLNNAPDAQPESWIPEVGDSIAGVVTEYTVGSTSYGDHPIVVLQDDQGGMHSVWLMHKVLHDEFRKQRPAIGERIGIRRLTDGQGGQGTQGYKRYRLIVDRDAEDALAVLGRDDLMPGDIPPGTNMSQADALGQAEPKERATEEFTSKSLTGDDDLPF